MSISDSFLANSRNVSNVIVNASGKVPVALGWAQFSVFLVLGLICFSLLGKIGLVVGTLAVVVGLIYLIRGYIAGAKARAAARATASAAIRASETAIRAVEVGQALVKNVVSDNGETESMAQRLTDEVEGRILKSAESTGRKLVNAVGEHTSDAAKSTLKKLSGKLGSKIGSHRA